MAFAFTTNQTPSTGAVAVWNLISRLTAQGWVKKADSDGSTYSASGTQVTGGGSGANGLGNSSAWVRIQDPGGGREFVFQRGSSGAQWRVKYSASAKFTGGSPGATQVPSASDEVVLFGAGSDTAPTTYALFSTDGSYRQQIGADSSAPYSFFAVCYPTGGGAPNSAILLDGLTGTATGDTDPVTVVVQPAQASNQMQLAGLGSSSAAGYECRCISSLMGVMAAGYVTTPAHYPASYSIGALLPYAGSNGWTGKDETFPVLYARPSSQSAPTGYKGQSSLMTWTGSSRTTGDTYSVSTTKDRIVIGAVSLPWDGTTTPAL